MEKVEKSKSVNSPKELKEFIQDIPLHQKLMIDLVMQECSADPYLRMELINIMTNGKNFYSLLCMFMDKRNISDVEFYNRAGISRAVFANMRRSEYAASKDTVLKSIIGLELNYTNASALLEKAGFSFVWKDPTDLVIIYCIMNQIYAHMEVDELLVSISAKSLFSIS